MHCILLRGLAREAGHWLDFPALLHQQLGAHSRIHLVDFPGCGQYYQQAALSSVSAMTEHARREVASATLVARHESIFVIGISMGGMVALDWAQRYPEELRGVVLINSSAGNHPVWWRLRPGAWVTMLHALLAPIHRREAQVLTMVSNNSAAYAQHLNLWLNLQQQHPVSRTTIITMLRAAAAFIPTPQCAVPGLILASTMDRMVAHNASRALAQHFSWPLQLHPDAGHDLPLDDGRWVATQIRHWLNNDLE